MRTLKKILITVIALIVAAVILGLFLPKERSVTRSVLIEAPPCAVFAMINGFRSFNDWSPFLALDPEATHTFNGSDFGVGAKMIWSGSSSDPNTGSREILASIPYERIEMQVDQGNKRMAESTFLLEPKEGGTGLTWVFNIDFGFNLTKRYSGLFLEREIGPLYAQGLINLKRIAEELPKVDWSDIEIGLTQVPSTTIAYTTGTGGVQSEEIANALAAAYGRVVGFIAANGLQLDGHPIAITNYRDDRGYGFDAGIPVSGAPTRGAGPNSPVRMGETYGGRVVRAVHIGPYSGMDPTYQKISAFIVAHNLVKNGRSWESYVSDPGNTKDKDLVTEIFFPVK